LNQIQQTGQFGLEALRNPMKGFEPQEEYARKQFATRTLPTIAERFGQEFQGNNRLGSSGFADILGQSASDFDAQLAALRSQYGANRENTGLKALQLGQTPTFENQLVQGDPGALSGILNALASAVPHALAGAATGGGSLIGSGISALTNFFNQRNSGGNTGEGYLGGGSPASNYANTQFQKMQQQPAIPYNQGLRNALFPVNLSENPAPLNPLQTSLHPSLQGKLGLPSQISIQNQLRGYGQMPSPHNLGTGQGPLFGIQPLAY
jgi:hypothetical protein